MEEFAHFISKQKSQCLQNHPRLEPSYKQSAVCGNKKVEEGEVCDCGSEEVSTNVGGEIYTRNCRVAYGSVDLQTIHTSPLTL